MTEDGRIPLRARCKRDVYVIRGDDRLGPCFSMGQVYQVVGPGTGSDWILRNATGGTHVFGHKYLSGNFEMIYDKS